MKNNIKGKKFKGLVRADLVDSKRYTENLALFSFRPSRKINFSPGQYVTLSITRGEDKSIMRPYSVASAPHEDTLDLYIAKVNSGGKRKDGRGEFTTPLFKKEDLTYFFSPKARGKFLIPDNKKTVIGVSTGTGIASDRSRIRDFMNRGLNKPYFIVHGVSSKADLVFRNEFNEMKSKGYPVTYIPIVSREECGDCPAEYVGELFFDRNGNKGRPTHEEILGHISNGRIKNQIIEEIVGTKLTPENSDISLCGNPTMIRNMCAVLGAHGYERGENLFIEKYW